MLHQVKEALRVKMANNEYVTLVHDATNEDPWGPTGPQMDDIAKVFHNGHDEIMEELTLRLKHRTQSWRSCYKSLLVIDHLARNVHESMIPVISALVPMLKQISQSFTCNEKGVDRGLSVRERSRKLVELLTDGQLLRDERLKSDATRRKVAGEPISMGTTSLSSSSATRTGAAAASGGYDTYDDGAPYRVAAHSQSVAKANPALREEQEKADMILAKRLQDEEERRAMQRGETIPYLDSQRQQQAAPAVIPVGRVKVPAASSARPSSQPPLSQEEVDHRIAMELQRRIDAGEPITPTLFNQNTAPLPAGPTASQQQQQVTKQQTPSTIDSLFDFSGAAATQAPASIAPSATTNSNDDFFSAVSASSRAPQIIENPPAAPQHDFDPFSSPPPAQPSARDVSETDFFDAFSSQRQVRSTPSTATEVPTRSNAQEMDLFASAVQQQSTTSSAAANPLLSSQPLQNQPKAVELNDDLFEQQMRRLQGTSDTSSSGGKQTLGEVSAARQPAW